MVGETPRPPPPEVLLLTRCLSCYRPFPGNDTLERLPHGQRVASDPARGRLWSVCPGCRRWTLQPIEERWEALDDIERNIERGRLLGSTDNIALFAIGDIEVVRVGHADLREEAWWRYGSEFVARRKRADRVARRGRWIDGAVLFLLTGIPYWGHSDAEAWVRRDRNKQFGHRAYQDLVACSRCGRRQRGVRFAEVTDVMIERMGPDGLAVRYACRRCSAKQPDAGFAFTGVAAEHLLRRTLAWHNFAGGSEATVQAAMSVVERSATIPEVLSRYAGRRPLSGVLPRTETLALEIALNADLEERHLEMELAELEARWREEELLAGIIDRELSPPR